MSLDERVTALEQKVYFIMQTLSLTRQLPNGKTDARSLTALFKEMQNHVGETSQTLTEVAERAFTAGDDTRPDRAEEPGGHAGTDDHDPDTATG